MTYLTAEELDAIQHMDRGAPYVIAGVSSGMFSIARHYGGMTYNTHRYTYCPAYDECVRNDVIKAVSKLRRDKAKAEHAANKAKQQELT